MEDDLKFAIQESSENAPVEKVKMFLNKFNLDFEPMIRSSEDPDIIRLYWRNEKLERVLTIYFKPNIINFSYVDLRDEDATIFETRENVTDEFVKEIETMIVKNLCLTK